MPKSQGFTLIEMVVVLIIISVVAAITIPNFTAPNEQARALNAWNNLLAIYSAEKDYYNSNNGVFVAATPLSAIDSTLSLNIQDDGTYTYSCTLISCVATRSIGGLTMTVTLGAPIQLNQSIASPAPNPLCSPINSTWCP